MIAEHQVVPAGYKQTEVGVIPEDWQTHTIGDSMRLHNGRAFKPEDWKDRGLPIIRIQNLNDPESDFNYFDGSIDDRNRIASGDLLFAWSGTKGTSFGARIWNGPEGVLNQHIFKVIPDPQKLTRKYALLVLRTVQDQITQQAHGFKASFVHVKKSDLIAVELPVPPTETEQEAIAEALGDADALIESLEQLVAKKRHLKQAAMQQLLTGKKRLPGFEVTGGAKETRLGVLPEDWDCIRVERIAASKANAIVGGPFGSDLVSTDYVDDGVPVIRGQNMSSKELAGDFAYVSEAKAGSLNANLARPDDVVFTQRGTVGQVSLVPNGRFTRYLVSQSQMKLSLDRQKALPEFVFYSFSSERQQRQIILSTIQTGVPHINLGILRKLLIAIPATVVEQEAIAEVLSDMDAAIEAVEAKLAKARQIKQGMMQELLTGRTRLV